MSWSSVLHFAEVGDGLITRSDLRSAGVSQRWLHRRIVLRELEVVHPNVLALPGVVMDLPTRFRAALLQAGPDAALSHASALEMYGLLQQWSHDVVHVSVPTARREVRGLCQHRRTSRETVWVAGMPVVPVKEALVGAVGLMDLPALRFPAMQAVHDGLLSAAELASLTGVPRAALKAVRLLGEEAIAGAESGGEANFFRLIEDNGLPVPVLQHRVMTHRGEKDVDGYWPDFRLGYEVDGREFHARKAAFEADPVRRNAIQATQIMVLNFPVSWIMQRPGEVLEDVRANLVARAVELDIPRRKLHWLR